MAGWRWNRSAYEAATGTEAQKIAAGWQAVAGGFRFPDLVERLRDGTIFRRLPSAFRALLAGWRWNRAVYESTPGSEADKIGAAWQRVLDGLPEEHLVDSVTMTGGAVELENINIGEEDRVLMSGGAAFLIPPTTAQGLEVVHLVGGAAELQPVVEAVVRETVRMDGGAAELSPVVEARLAETVRMDGGAAELLLLEALGTESVVLFGGRARLSAVPDVTAREVVEMAGGFALLGEAGTGSERVVMEGGDVVLVRTRVFPNDQAPNWVLVRGSLPEIPFIPHDYIPPDG